MVVQRVGLTLLIVVLASAARVPNPQKHEGMRLIELNVSSQVWMTQEQVDKLIFTPGKQHNFMDVTDAPQPRLNTASMVVAFPDQPNQREIVTPLLSNIDIPNMQKTLQTLTEFYTRYYTSATGLQAAQWIHAELVSIKGARDDITVSYFENTWLQPSVIARIEGAHDGPASIVILGSHLDSVGTTSTGRSPGADDDGSGSTCNLETFRIIVNSGLVFQHPIEFHFYSAEEVGLWGSQAIANNYSAEGVEVYGMMQLDMTMYNGDTVPFIAPTTDFTSPELTAFMRILIDTYCDIGWTNRAAGYGSSDHASWTRTGVASVFPFEATNEFKNPNVHSDRDIIANLSFEHGAQFVKLALSYIVELGNYVEQ